MCLAVPLERWADPTAGSLSVVTFVDDDGDIRSVRRSVANLRPRLNSQPMKTPPKPGGPKGPLDIQACRGRKFPV
jgi:hypothetical protein